MDADAWLAQGIKRMSTPQTEDELEMEELWKARREAKAPPADEYAGSYEFFRDQMGGRIQ